MNLIEKLQAVEMKADNRITEQDRFFCETQQKAYDSARDALSELLSFWENIVSEQKEILKAVESESYGLTRYVASCRFSSHSINDSLETLPTSFIERIVQYFNHKYHVSVDADTIRKTLFATHQIKASNREDREAIRALKLRYEEIVEQILLQLGGRTFHERALDELKDKCHVAAWNAYRQTCNYELKNDTIRFDQYACSYERWLDRDRWELNERMRAVMQGIAHFETGTFHLCPHGLSELLGYCRLETPQLEFPTCDKLQQMRLFKNGRVDLKFASKAIAAQFASDYLGLVY